MQKDETFRFRLFKRLSGKNPYPTRKNTRFPSTYPAEAPLNQTQDSDFSSKKNPAQGKTRTPMFYIEQASALKTAFS